MISNGPSDGAHIKTKSSSAFFLQNERWADLPIICNLRPSFRTENPRARIHHGVTSPANSGFLVCPFRASWKQFHVKRPKEKLACALFPHKFDHPRRPPTSIIGNGGAHNYTVPASSFPAFGVEIPRRLVSVKPCRITSFG